MGDNGTTFSGTLTVANANTSYTWNGSYFDIFSIQCTTPATITAANTPGGTPTVTSSGGVVTINLGYQSMFGLGQSVPITLAGNDNGVPANFSSCTPNYVRGANIIYPQYAGLPSSWQKNKANLSASDLIANPTSYYQTTIPAVTDKFIAYSPPHPTQIELNQTLSVPYPVNNMNGVRIYIPNSYMAMGLAFNYEMLKINPGFQVALGTKENFAAGVVPASTGVTTNPVVINGVTWYWPIQFQPDGPYQQQADDFNSVVSYFPDFFPPGAAHGNYTTVANAADPNWISATISSGLSLTITRETLNAVPAVNYVQFMQQAADPWAEMEIIAFGYNRGIGSIWTSKIFTTNRAAALASTNIANDFNMGGFASYVPTLQAIIEATNADQTMTYDAQISWADMTTFFTELQKFYGNGVPSTTDWNAMISDVQKAFNVLAAHWGTGGTISYRYDFLTLLRVAKQYLPQPYNPRPTGSNWYYLITGAQP